MKDQNMIKISAPSRVDLSGQAADMFEGCTLSAAIDLRTNVKISDFNKLEYDKNNDIISSIINRFNIKNKKIKIDIKTLAPRQSGLGGSASFSVSTIFGLNKKFNWNLNLYQIAEHAQRAESIDLNMRNGYQDWYISSFGGILFMNFHGKTNKEVGKEPFGKIQNLTEYMNLYLVVADTGIKHLSGISNENLYKRYMKGDITIRNLINKLNVLTKKGRDCIISKDINGLANIMNENQNIFRVFGWSIPENEKLIKIALDNGALAAKITGAGCGGAIVALCKDEKNQKKVANALKKKSKFVHICKIDEGVRFEN